MQDTTIVLQVKRKKRERDNLMKCEIVMKDRDVQRQERKDRIK